MNKIFYNKLIRDKIPAKLDALGVAYEVHTLDDTEFKTALLKKIAEESGEIALAKDRSIIIAELADLIDVLEEVARVYEISDQDIKAAQNLNKENKGGFEDKIFLEWSADDGYKTNETATPKLGQAED